MRRFSFPSLVYVLAVCVCIGWTSNAVGSAGTLNWSERTFDTATTPDFAWCGNTRLLLRGQSGFRLIDIRNGKEVPVQIGRDDSAHFGCTPDGALMFTHDGTRLTFSTLEHSAGGARASRTETVADTFPGNPVSPSVRRAFDQSASSPRTEDVLGRRIEVVPVNRDVLKLMAGVTNLSVAWNSSESRAAFTTAMLRPLTPQDLTATVYGYSVATQDLKTGKVELSQLSLAGGVLDHAQLLDDTRLILLVSPPGSSDFAAGGDLYLYDTRARILEKTPLHRKVDRFTLSSTGLIVFVRSDGIDGKPAEGPRFTANAASSVYAVSGAASPRLIRTVQAELKYPVAGPKLSPSGQAFALLRLGAHGSTLHIFSSTSAPR